MLLASVALTACGNKVDCNGSAVKKDALQIIQSHLDGAAWYNEMKLAITGDPKLENIKTVDADKDGKQAQCKASYSINYNDKLRSIDVSYDLAYLEDKKETEVKVAVGEVQGGLMGLAMVERPLKNGEEKVYDIYNHKLVAVRRWKKGREDGEQDFYDRDTEALVHQYQAADGTKVGAEKMWSPDGAVVTELAWANGKATGTMLGDTNGNPINRKIAPYLLIPLKNGLKEGAQKTFSSSAAGEYVAKFENFKDGKLNGLTQQFNDHGDVVYEVRYDQGKLVLDDAATARSLDACVEAWVARAQDSGLERWADDAQREYKRGEYRLNCEKGRLP